MLPDAELLRRYAEQGDNAAFAEFVRRHLGMVYFAALRRLGGRTHLAEDVAQKVFSDVARKAATLCRHSSLTGWLYRSTRYVSVDAIRAEARREKAVRNFAAMSEDSEGAADVEWRQIRPVLDAALDELKDHDREVMLLRFFEGLSFAELGEHLGISENTARMRTERALDKLRGPLRRRGITSTSVALGLLLTNRALAQIPEGLADSVATEALAQPVLAAGGGMLSVSAYKFLLAAALLGTAGAGVWGWRWVAGRFPDDGQPDPALVLAADGFAAQALAVYETMERIHPLSGETPGSGTLPALPQRDGQGGPLQALLEFSQACEAGDIAALSRRLTFDPAGRERARSIHAGMPESVRLRLSTPEELFAFFYATDALLSPPPPRAFLERFVGTELRPGRVGLHPPDAHPPGLEFVLTADGWKHEVPAAYLPVLAARVVSSATVQKLQSRVPLRSRPEGTARAAFLTLAAACNRGDVTAVAARVCFEPAARRKALAFLAALPSGMRGKWRTPEELAADLLVAEAIDNPYPGAEVLDAVAEERVADGRTVLVLRDTTRERIEYQRTGAGWQRAITEEMVDHYLGHLARSRMDR